MFHSLLIVYIYILKRYHYGVIDLFCVKLLTKMKSCTVQAISSYTMNSQSDISFWLRGRECVGSKRGQNVAGSFPSNEAPGISLSERFKFKYFKILY